jgi:preprotein translocase subunit SecY
MKRSPWRYLWQTEDIRNKLLITFLLLVLYRLAANIPVPGINQAVLSQLANAKGATGNLVNLLDLLSGGTISSFSILAMGVYPYITAQIILQLLGPIIPALERKMKENPTEYQKWQERWTVILTVPMALLSAIGQEFEYLLKPCEFVDLVSSINKAYAKRIKALSGERGRQVDELMQDAGKIQPLTMLDRLKKIREAEPE